MRSSDWSSDVCSSDLFSVDCETDYGTFGRWRGPREVTENMQQAHEQFGPTLHRMTNFTIESDGVQVRARSYVDTLIMPIAAGGPIHRVICVSQANGRGEWRERGGQERLL